MESHNERVQVPSGTKDFGICLGGHKVVDHKAVLKAFVDADYANCVDTRRSVSGYVTFAFDSPISWISKKQELVTLSTTEAEFVALSQCIQEVRYLRTMLSELGFDISEPSEILEDNQSCIRIANNPELHGRTKHISIKYFFVQESIENKEIILSYCRSQDQIADIFTKALSKQPFTTLRGMLRVFSKRDFN